MSPYMGFRERYVGWGYDVPLRGVWWCVGWGYDVPLHGVQGEVCRMRV